MQKLCHATKFSKTCHFKFLNNVNKKLKYYCLIDVITVYTVVNFFSGAIQRVGRFLETEVKDLCTIAGTLTCKKGVLKDFAKFTREHLFQSLIFNKVIGNFFFTLVKYFTKFSRVRL